MIFKAAKIEPANAVILATVAAGLQRLFQIASELIMATFGAIVTRQKV